MKNQTSFYQARLGSVALLSIAAVLLSGGVLGCDAVSMMIAGITGQNGDEPLPTVTAPADLTVECDGAGNQAELTAWLDSAVFTEGCGDPILENDFVEIDFDCGQAGSVTVTWTVTDDCGETDTDSATFTIEDTTPPDLTVPAPITVTCGETGTADALNDWLADTSSSDQCGDVAITTERSLLPGSCTATITWTATDDCGNETSLASTYTTTGDTTDPTLVLVGDATLTLECGTEWEDPGATAADDCDALIRSTVAGSVDLHTPGDYTLTYSAADACGNEAPDVVRMVTVVDTTPPEVDVSEPALLWPPNHELKTLTLADIATVTDLCEGELDINEVGTILDIYSDEPDDVGGGGDGHTTGDIAIVDDHTFSVRSERQGGSNGRVYGIRFMVEDAAGNTTEATGFVHVVHDQSGRSAVDDGAGAGQIIVAN